METILQLIGSKSYNHGKKTWEKLKRMQNIAYL